VPFLRRLAFAPLVFLAVVAVTYGVPRVLRPDRYPGEGLISGVVHDLDRVLLHMDWGNSVILVGNPPVHGLWAATWIWDLWLLIGGLVIGVAGGILTGVWCARRPRSLRARAVEAAAMAAYCSPVFFTGLFLLSMFNPDYGRIPLPLFFDAEPQFSPPWVAPWDWFQAMLVPWLVVGAPLGAMCLRLTVSATREAMQEEFVRTAEAKGIPWKAIVRRHAAPLSYPATISFVGVSAPLLITNMVLVERVFSVPGFFRYTWRAAGHANFGNSHLGNNEPVPDFALLCALGLWAALLLIILGLIADGIVSKLDPHVRTSSAQAW
jgi:peptide/nickel transport system permease protein